MAITQSRIEAEDGRRVAIAEFSVDELSSPIRASQFKSELVKLIGEQQPDVLILNWGRVSRAGTDVFGVLLALQRRLYQWNGELRLCNLSPLLREELSRCGLAAILPLYPDLAGARAARRGSS